MRLSRRQFISGSNARSFHIASMVVQCLPEKLDVTAAALSALPSIEVPEQDARGKMVVLIEADDEATLMSCIGEIESTPGVISANLVFHQIED